MIHLYINATTGALIKSLTSDALASPPNLVAGDEAREIVLHFCSVTKPDAFTTTITELDYSGWAVQLSVGVIGAKPTAGTFPLTFGANTEAAIARDATDAQIETALNALASMIAAGGVDVEGNAGGPYSVVFRTVGARDLLASANDSLFPDSDVFIQRSQIGSVSLAEIQTISIVRKPFVLCETWSPYVDGGLYGLLDLSALPQIEDLFGTAKSLVCTLEIKVAPPGGQVGTLTQASIQVNKPLMPVNAVGPAAVSSYLTAAQSRLFFVWNRADVTGLTGGGEGNLDGIVSAGLPLEILIQTSASSRVYRLAAGTDAENSPVVIRPDDYNADTNARVWKLQTALADVVGPASATDGEIVAFDGATGKLLKSIGKTFVGLMSDVSSAISAAITALGLGNAATKDVGTTAGTVAAGDDARLSDSRTPTAHASSHATGQADAITPANIGAATSGHNHDAAYEAKTLTTKGDILTHSGTAAARLAAGTNGQVLMADSTATNGVKWAAAPETGITALAVVVADQAARLALTGKPIGFRAYQISNHHVYELSDASHPDSDAYWIDLGDVLPYAATMATAPTISGTEQVGETLTATSGTYNGRPTPSHSAWQWQTSDTGSSGWSDISGATSDTYVPVAGDEGKYLRVGEKCSNALGESSFSYSAATGAIAAAAPSNYQATGISLVNAGTGYSVNDELHAYDGTYSTVLKFIVDSVDGSGAITGLHISDAGSYSVTPSNPVSFGMGTGDSGCSGDVTWEAI